jgi:hypothetical protein
VIATTSALSAIVRVSAMMPADDRIDPADGIPLLGVGPHDATI